MLTRDYISTIAQAYDSAPIVTPEAYDAWEALSNETAEHYHRISQCLSIGRTTNPNPYASSYDMLRDIAQGHIWVSTANSEHPLWTTEENVMFRVVHDIMGHGATGSGFDWTGENRAYANHLEHTVNPKARLALFTEAIGQVAFALDRGAFGVQKCALLPQWLQFVTTKDAN